MERAHIALNKNTVPGDKSAMVPHGIRMGAPALTSRGFAERDFEQARRRPLSCLCNRILTFARRLRPRESRLTERGFEQALRRPVSA